VISATTPSRRHMLTAFCSCPRCRRCRVLRAAAFISYAMPPFMKIRHDARPRPIQTNAGARYKARGGNGRRKGRPVKAPRVRENAFAEWQGATV